MRLALFFAVLISPVFGQSTSTCVNFPSGFIPFSAISYVTAADSAGDHLVVGVPASGALASINANIPLPAATNQTFCGQVQLAPNQFYPSVYVPTAAELTGNFAAFSGLLTVPGTSSPYAGGVIPPSQLGSVFAWRIGPSQAGAAHQNWGLAGSLTPSTASGSVFGAATRLPSGKVLFVGAVAADLYDSIAGTFTFAGFTVFGHGATVTATLLNTGQVLIVGGQNTPSSSEIYDPLTGKFTAGAATVYPHGYGQTATLLNDGRVLIVGGVNTSGCPLTSTGNLNSGAEIYDPGTGKFAAAGPMSANRNNHISTLLGDGRVLVTGGNTLACAPTQIFNSAEVFNPSNGTFTLVGSMETVRAHHFAVLLASGKVLVGGGFAGGASAELFDPISGSFTPTGSMTNQMRANPIATVLPSGQVLVAGGVSNDGTVVTGATELYDPPNQSFSTAGSMVVARQQASAATLLDGRVFVAGGGLGSGSGAIGLSAAEIYTPTTEGLITSQSGLTFQSAQGNAAPVSQTVQILSNTTTIPWTVSVHTYEGGNWLTAAPSSGNSVPGVTPTNLIIAANPSGLAAQDYYGSVTLTPTDGVHPPVAIAVVLHIVPAGTAAPPIVSPTGLLFIGPPGSTLNAQNFNITNLTSTAISFAANGSNTPKFFSVTPASGSIPAASTATITVTPSLTGLTAGVYNGTITLSFAGGSTQAVSLLLVVSSTATSHARPQATTTLSCNPSKLLPVFTSIGSGFNTPTSWPVPIFVTVVDDCGDLINSGNVIVSFSNGDAPIPLLSTGSGMWSATWVPVAVTTGFSARADATQAQLTGSSSVSGQVLSNPTVPVISPGGVVASIDFSSAPSVGQLVSIFGSNLADSQLSSPVPLPPQLGTTSVTLTTGESLPILFVNSQLINVLIPYDVPLNTGLQLAVQRGPAVSVPVALAVFAATPAIVSENGSGTGQGDVFVIGAGGIETLADQNHPATTGNPVVIYCVGLGAVNPGITAGQTASLSTLSYAAAPVTVTFGNVTVAAGFAGLTPGEIGLYQINTTIPTGVPTGNQVPITISAGGASSSAKIYMAIH